MYYGFQTNREEVAVGALLVYAVYMSRDKGKFKVDYGMWGRIESSARSAARKARRDMHIQADPAAGLPAFVERLKPKLMCRTVIPRYMSLAQNTTTSAILPTGELVELKEEGKRSFWNELFEDVEPEPVLRAVQKQTGLVVGCVRERIERERALMERGFLESDDDVIEIEG